MTRNYTYPEAAVELRVLESWLRRHIKKLPHSKKGKVVTFSEDDIKRIDALHHHEPSTGPLAPAPRPSSGASLHPMSHLQPLPSRRAAVRTG